MAVELQVLTVPDAAALRLWLEAGPTAGVWLTLAKKAGAPHTTLSYAEAVDEALCFGWIDGQARSVDDATYQLRFTPRRPRSPWSKRNVDHVSRLTAEGRMNARGIAEVERAKADGRWERAYAGSATIELPDDLAAALELEPRASVMFGVLTSQNRYAILYRLHEAKRPETRQRRLEHFISMLARGETPYPQKKGLPE